MFLLTFIVKRNWLRYLAVGIGFCVCLVMYYHINFNCRVVLPFNDKSHIRKFPTTGHRRTFLYLLLHSGSEAEDSIWFDVLYRTDSDLIVLTYTTNFIPHHFRQRATHIHVENSTWTSSRNILLQTAKLQETKQGWRYKYFIFCDADIVLRTPENSANIFGVFHKFLDREKPAIGIPKGGWCGGRRGDCETNVDSALATCDFDGAVNAFHRDVVDVVLPYSEDLDSISWWHSQVILWLIVCPQFPGLILQTCDVECDNPSHNENYPRKYPYYSMWDKGRIMHEVVDPSIIETARYRLPAALQDCVNYFSTANVVPRSLLTVEEVLADPPRCTESVISR